MILRISLFLLCILLIFLFPHLLVVIQWDEAVLHWITQHRSASLDRIFFFITDLGSTEVFLVALLFPTLLFCFRRAWGRALAYFAGVGLLKVSVSLLKELVGRPRPPEGLEMLYSFSMPSGHAANAVIIFGGVGMALGRKISSKPLRNLVFAFCFLMIFAIGFSRIYLGVHYLSDVVLGTLYTACGLWILEGFGIRPLTTDH